MESKNFVIAKETNNELKEASEIIEKLKKYRTDKEVNHQKSLKANESGARSKQTRVPSKLQTKSIQEEYKPI